MWEKDIKNLGKTKSKKRIQFSFKYNGTLHVQTHKGNGEYIILAGCKLCTRTHWNKKNNVLDVYHTVEDIPKSLMAKGIYEYSYTKHIIVHERLPDNSIKLHDLVYNITAVK